VPPPTPPLFFFLAPEHPAIRAACIPLPVFLVPLSLSLLFLAVGTRGSGRPDDDVSFFQAFFPKYLKKKAEWRSAPVRVRGVKRTWGETPRSASTRSVLAYRVCTFNTPPPLLSAPAPLPIRCRVHPRGDVRRLNGDFLLPRSRFPIVTTAASSGVARDTRLPSRYGDAFSAASRRARDRERPAGGRHARRRRDRLPSGRNELSGRAREDADEGKVRGTSLERHEIPRCDSGSLVVARFARRRCRI